MLDEKDLKQQLMDSVNDDAIPNMATKIKANYQKKSQNKKPWYKSGWLYGLGTPILACGIAAAIIIPNINIKNPIETLKPLAIVGKKNEIAFGVLSASNMLTFEPVSNPVITAKMKQDISKTDFEKEVRYLNAYMPTAEVMLDENLDLNPIVEKNNDLAFDFEYVMKINNNGEEFLFYYNEILDQEIKLEQDDDDDDDNDDSEEENEDNEEQEYTIDGLFIKNGTQFYVSGEKELEPIDNEYELELMIYKDKSDKNHNHILIEQEIENSGPEKEESYLYSVVENGEKVFKAEIKFDADKDNKPNVEIKIKSNDTESSYKIEKNNDSFNVEYESKNSSGDIIVNIENLQGSSNYIYKEKDLGYILKLKRN